jgi:hypothetical protein
MPGPFTARQRPSSLLNHDWLAEFPQESPPKSRMLAGATTQAVITYKAPPSVNQIVRERPHRSILVARSAIVLMISAGTAIAGLWMRVALAPLPPDQWPVPPPILSSPAAAPGSTVAGPALEPAPEPAAELTPAPAVPIAAAPNTPATLAVSVTKAPAPAAAAEDPAASVATPDPSPAASSASEVSVILSVLDRYRLALGSLNPGSVRAVWPAADLRALAREFADIKRQTFAFDSCRIDVQGGQAEAVCGGRVSLVTKAAPPAPSIQSRRWVFTLVRDTNAWKIQTVTTQ